MTAVLLALLSAVFFSGGVAGGVPFQALAPNQPGMRLRLNFPERATLNQDRLTYVLQPRSDIEIDIQASVGDDVRLELPATLHATLLIDGLQIPVKVNGSRAPQRAFELVVGAAGRVVRVSMVAAGKSLEPGPHQAALMLWRSGGESFPSATFTIQKEGAGGRSRRPPTTTWSPLRTERPTGRPGYEMRPGPGSMALLRGRMPGVGPDERGRLRVRTSIELAPAADGGDPRTSVARKFGVTCLVNGRQILVEGREPLVRATVGPGQRVEGDIELAGLPGTLQTESLLVCFLITAEEGSCENPGGGFAPWFQFPQLIGSLRW